LPVTFTEMKRYLDRLKVALDKEYPVLKLKAW